MEKSQISAVKLIVSSEDASIPLDFVDETLDEMTFFVEMFIILSLLVAPSGRRDDGDRIFVGDSSKNRVCIIGFIGDSMVKRKGFYQCFRLCTIVTLPTRQSQLERIANCIDKDVNLGAESASAAAERLL